MRIVLRTFSSDENYNSDLEYAYVLMTPGLAKVLAGRHNLLLAGQTSNPDLVEVHFRSGDDEVEFYSWLAFNDDANGFLPGKEAEKTFEEQGWTEIPEDSSFQGDLYKDSFDETYTICNEQGFYWETYLKHAGTRIQTEVLPREVLAKLI